MAGPQAGNACKLFYNSGTHASPTWVEIDEVDDVSISELARSLAETKRRSTQWVKNFAGKLSAAIEFGYLYRANATVFDVLRAAFFAGTVIEFWVADGGSATTGTEGLRIYCLVANFPVSQPLEEAAKVDSVRLAPAYFEESSAEIDPDWYVIS